MAMVPLKHKTASGLSVKSKYWRGIRTPDQPSSCQPPDHGRIDRLAACHHGVVPLRRQQISLCDPANV
ncbi:hypothetical protein HMPREF9622_01912 [Cutibacterium modestum HL037PA3]|uniref:Uncharacterized protein n=1 Tax=Cutibacterium modestum HL044PA1 TaxID=765109 RepID=A0ABN0C6Z2_9ACTN|nr:hypothetical protein HMPREF9621_02847 [Cutibacterium modestum HL037PA2]EFS93029.1 hypothetical protein HMPREF9607_00880 [Cutibacterium modestum HL044PA1]EFT14945.1 hypothetical protein HMPREF9622_01912 [Cutibacterium modestum HL037PA3]